MIKNALKIGYVLVFADICGFLKFNSVTEQLKPEDIKSIAENIYQTGLDLTYFIQTTGVGLHSDASKKTE